VAARIPGRLGKWLVSGPPLVYLLVFFAIPALIMVVASFRTPGEFGGLAPLRDESGNLDLNLESYARFFGEPLYAEIFLKSFWYALATTLFCLVLAYPLAALIAQSERRHRDLLLRFWRVTFPLSLPGVYAGSALVFIPAFGIFAIPDILGGPNDSLIGNVIKQQFLETRDWPFGSVLSIVLTVCALGIAGAAAWVGQRGVGRLAAGDA